MQKQHTSILFLSGLIITATSLFLHPTQTHAALWEEHVVTSAGPGGSSHIRTFDKYGTSQENSGDFFAYNEQLRTGFNVASADLDNNETEEIVTAPQHGAAPHIRTFSKNGDLAFTPGFYAYSEHIRCGVDIATGDVNGDGIEEIVTIPGEGCPAHVRIFDRFGEPTHNCPGFYAYAENVRTGFHIAVGDLDGDLTDEIITIPEKNAPAHVRAFTCQGEPQHTPGFFAYGTAATGGDVTTGDLDFNGEEEIITIPGEGSPSHVRIFDKTGAPTLHPGFFAYDQGTRTGFRIASGDLERDGSAEIITIPQGSAPTHTRIFNSIGEPQFTPGFYAYADTLPIGGDVTTFQNTQDLDIDLSGALVWWDHPQGLETIQTMGGQAYAIAPFWYELKSDGTIDTFNNAEEKKIRTYLKDSNVKVLPFISNEQTAEPLATIIADETQRIEHVETIRALVEEKGYDGIHLNYENLTAADRDSLSLLHEELADALHTDGKLLSTSLHAKTSEPGSWGGPQSQDWERIGRACDRVKIMTYDYSWSTSPAGAIAPPSWVEDVIEHGLTLIPKEKIYIGIPLYGYDWIGSEGAGVTYEEAMALADTNKATIHFDDTTQSNWFTYSSEGKNHEVWFENGRSTQEKFNLAVEHELGGIDFWRLGGEDPTTWNRVEETF